LTNPSIYESLNDMARTRNRRLDLILRLLKQMVKNPSARLDELAILSEIAPITLYRYFESREGLVRSISEYIIDDFSIASDTIFQGRGNFEGSIGMMIDFFLPRLDSVRFLFQLDSFVDPTNKNLKDVYKTVLGYRKDFGLYIYKLVQKGIKEGYLRKDVDPKWIARTFVWMLFGAREFEISGANTNEYLREKIIETLVYGNHRVK